MKQITSFIYVVLFSGCLSFMLSCKKFLEIPPPQTQAQTTTVFSNDQSAISAVTGMYSQMGQTNLTMLNGGVTIYAGLSADEFANTSPDGNWDPFTTNTLTPENGVLSSRFWQHAYKNIYQANLVIEALEKSTVTDSLKRQLKGEVLTIRALHYFYLVNLFGDVPLITGTDFRVNSTVPRSSASIVYQHIINDLSEAQLLLSQYTSPLKGRVNKWAATALLARAYLYIGDWVNAEAQATLLIQSGAFSLASVSTVFQSSSTETIWQLLRDNNNTAEAASFVPSSLTVKPTMTLTTSTLSGFQQGDVRKTAWVAKNTVAGTDYYYPNKYKSRLSTPISEYLVVVRLGEQYLIRAEARARQNNFTGSAADLNVLRLRAGLAPTGANTQAVLLNAIEKERQCELFAEWGHRWLDLKRSGKIDAVLSGIKMAFWQTTDALYPIPLYELQTNPQLTQNPGY